MKAVRCTNGHYFDGDVYVICPHCGAEIGSAGGDQEKKTVGLAFLSRRSTAEKEQTAAGAASEQDTREKAKSSQAAVQQETVSADDLKEALKQSSAAEEGKTLSFFSMMSGAGQGGGAAAAAQASPAGTSAAPSPAAARSEAVQPAAAEASGQSIGSAAEPPTGFLIAVEGPHLGEAFGIYAGLNSIGRSRSNRIVLNKDFSVSREKHALLTYEPKKRKFYIERGESTGLTYINGDFITSLYELKERDIIELGASHFLFLPLCGESFSWEEYLSKR